MSDENNTNMYIGLAVVAFIVYYYMFMMTPADAKDVDAKATADAAAAAKATAATAAAKAAADALIAGARATAAADAARDAARAAAARVAVTARAAATAAACNSNSNLNTFTINNQKVICPPGFVIENNNKYWSDTTKNTCIMTQPHNTNCGWGSCDPSKYELPGGLKWPNMRFGDPRPHPVSSSGYYLPQTYPDVGTFYMTTPLPYDKYCS